MNTIADRVRARRNKLGLSQKELAKKYLLDVKNGGFGFDRNKSMELMKQAAVNGDIYAQNFILKAEKSSK